MKVSYRNMPILKILEQRDLNAIKVLNLDKDSISYVQDDIDILFNSNIEKFNNNINIISDSFHDACVLAKDKLFNVYNENMEILLMTE